MAAGSTIYKAQLSISDMDRNYYETHDLTIAQHPSETDQRLMIRLAAFALNASDRMIITKGIGGDDEPELWEKNYGDEVVVWIDLGQMDEKRLRKACGRADAVVVLAYGGRQIDAWWAKDGPAMTNLDKLRVFSLNSEQSMALAELAKRGMELQCTIQDSQVWITDGPNTVAIEPRRLLG